MTARIAWTTVLIATTGAALLAQPTTRALRLPETSRKLTALARDEPTTAYLVVAVDESGRTFIRTTGVADPEPGIPFQQHTRVPLGAVTRYLLHEAFRHAVARHKLRWDDAIGATLPDLPDAVRSHRWEQLVSSGPTFLPNYLRWVRDPRQARPLDRILGDHAFVPYGEVPEAERRSMLRAALMQRGLERVHGKPWPAILEDTARELGVRGMFASEPEHRAGGVARRLRGGEPTDLWHAEVASAGGATATAPAIAALLRHFLARDVEAGSDCPEGAFPEWHDGIERGVSFVERLFDTPGVTGSVRTYADPRVAVFTFANRANWPTPRDLQQTILADLVDEPERREFFLCGGVELGGRARPDQAGVLLYAGVLELRGVQVPVQLEVTCAKVAARAAMGTVTTGNLFHLPRGARVDLSVPAFALPGAEQRANLRLFASGVSLRGTAHYVAHFRRFGTVEDLPYPVTFARLPEDARRLPLAWPRR